MNSDGGAADAADLSDDALIAAVAAHADRAAFAELFQRFAGRIKGFLMKGGMARDEAEELAQEVMVTIWRKSAQFDPARAGAATWIFTIARNRRIDHLRRGARAEPDPADPLLQSEPEPDPADRLAGESRDAQVRAALGDLSDEQREVVQLAFYAGLSHGEIADQLGTPLGTVKSRLRLSFKRLKGVLGAGFSDELTDD
ncbi:MAG: sigma-70 family RNA polymerase sigma factor [Pseudomonadota bacterium]